MHSKIFKVLFLGNSTEKQSAAWVIFFFFFLALYGAQIELEEKEPSLHRLTLMIVYTLKRKRSAVLHKQQHRQHVAEPSSAAEISFAAVRLDHRS